MVGNRALTGVGNTTLIHIGRRVVLLVMHTRPRVILSLTIPRVGGIVKEVLLSGDIGYGTLLSKVSLRSVHVGDLGGILIFVGCRCTLGIPGWQMVDLTLVYILLGCFIFVSMVVIRLSIFSTLHILEVVLCCGC